MSWEGEIAWKESVKKMREEQRAKEEAHLAMIRGLTGHSIIEVVEKDYDFVLLFDNKVHVTVEEEQFEEGEI